MGVMNILFGELVLLFINMCVLKMIYEWPKKMEEEIEDHAYARNARAIQISSELRKKSWMSSEPYKDIPQIKIMEIIYHDVLIWPFKWDT